MSSQLSSLLSEYAVPLRVWLAPAARSIAADTLIDTLGHLAQVDTDPLRASVQLRGPAVLVLAAEDLSGPHREPLRDLAERALPGRVVLIGGTSDRDVLMDAINTWRAVKVVPSTAPGAEIVDAVRAAGEALRKAVALSTALDDLDIENTMLDSAISQMEAGQGRAQRAAKEAAMSTMSQGLAQTIERQQAAWTSLAQEDQDLTIALKGVRTMTDLLGQISNRSAEAAAGLQLTAESVDAMVAAAADLAGRGPGPEIEVQADSGALSRIHPYALIHLLTHLLRSSRAAGPTRIRCTGCADGVQIALEGTMPSLTEGSTAHSAQVLTDEGGSIQATAEGGLTITLPVMVEDH